MCECCAVREIFEYCVDFLETSFSSFLLLFSLSLTPVMTGQGVDSAPPSHICSEKERLTAKDPRPMRGKERIDYRELGKKGTAKPLSPSPPADSKFPFSLSP